jgi:hypothetical protein
MMRVWVLRVGGFEGPGFKSSWRCDSEVFRPSAYRVNREGKAARNKLCPLHSGTARLAVAIPVYRSRALKHVLGSDTIRMMRLNVE